MKIRLTEKSDAEQIAEIYAHYALHSVFTFDTKAPSVRDIENKISECQITHLHISALDGPELLGYAYAQPYRSRNAYDWACETSIYVKPDNHRHGIGSILYSKLISCLSSMNYRILLAGITIPNPTSDAFHARHGFRPDFRMKNIGYKLGEWYDVMWWRRDLEVGSERPSDILNLEKLGDKRLREILSSPL